MIDNSFFELGGRYWLLTTEHPSSSYGKPVLIETDRLNRDRIGDPIGLADIVYLSAVLPERSLGLEVAPVDPSSPLRAYTGREIASYGAHPETVAAYLLSPSA